jgi:hypothetical protein
MSAYTLINQEKSSLEEVVQSLIEQKSGTEWATKTNELAINYIRHLSEVYGNNWSKGLLTQESFSQILLPKHEHMIDIQPDLFIFPLDTPITKAIDHYKNNDSIYAKECLEAIHHLKDKIKKDGFTSPIVLAVINDTLKHVDGLHRLLALHLAIQEGYEYKPTPTFICNNQV